MSEYISLEQYNTYRIKSYAKHVYFPSNEQQLLEIINKHNQVFFLGNGSNIIFSKEYYDDVAFVVFCKNFNSYTIRGNCLDVQAGALLQDLALATYHAGLSGIETFYDVPASVGGALIMNAGAYGDEIYTYIKSVTVLDLEAKQIKKYFKEDIEYGYRYSMFKYLKNICILSAEFEFEPKSKQDIKAKLDDIYSRRLLNLPQKPTAGSVFKRPQANVPVGVMVEELGLKGKQIGGAQISLKHGGIIVNNDNATGQDILQLIEFIKQQILEHYNIELHEEQIVI
ncbi:UDP-N-acetylmuramate dehydrogenase [Francisella philomiragia]|uniref:UDP-N-acetylmuramate dehydrogenase n=1 Tax=Francisella philomiragia TaxID=28110 RepID=UPI0019063C9F|nr:UDP-N-acetylmuramate dehydrogenase [Francisella philomiragia]MBK2268218.1 UDP-N-acetylmuramate dehydrogenase [Francisella philomiragia]MBK2279676.1 UDP-N-acetylmuramate dehydrogenase [Francisella philomiragia]MBK2287529.1 UDP-N-acetylmuramate dehydrogenase [Francisella philomiragia]MBK2289508.1 UDP-N-acetylmuramate dehydrogenase [Francisella philomiragia]MBK2291233.1 UDP-N-acetylmuramate dehydrogenase [Francisella philomiragia]